MFCQVVWGVFSVLWGSVGVCGVLRSVRGRFSQVKGAFGVAKAMPLRGTLDLRASTAPPGSVTGRPQACPPSRAPPPRAPTHTPQPHPKTAKQQHPKIKTRLQSLDT